MVGNLLRDLPGSSQKLHGREFNGVVVDNNDPERLQRVRVRIRDLHAGIEDADIPWATKRDAARGTAPGVTSVDIPPLGANVKIMFRDESFYSPTYYGGSFEGTGQKAPAEGYPHVIIESDHAGNVIRRDTRAGSNTFTFTHVTGATFHIANDGSITWSTPKNVNINAGQSIDIRATESIKIQAKTILHLRGNSLLLQDAPPQDPATTTAGTRPVIPFTKDTVEY